MDETEVILKPKAGSGPPKNVRKKEILLRGTCGECDPVGED
jgi:hypothetical protein